MGKLIVVQDDKVEGTDKHNVSGDATNPSPPPLTIPYVGVADFDYKGKITDDLSDFTSIERTAVAVVDSKSTLEPGEDSPPAGKHSGPLGSNFVPPAPVPIMHTSTFSSMSAS